MNRKIKKVLVLFLTLLLFSGCTSQEPVPNTDEQANSGKFDGLGKKEEEEVDLSLYDYTSPTIFEEEEWYEYIPKVELSGVMPDGSAFQLDPIGGCGIQQGCCTDGTYAYMALNDGKKVATTYIAKMNLSDWSIVKVSEPLYVDHANSMAYNSKENRIYITHADSGVYNKVSIIDPETLTVIGDFTVDYEMGGVAYNETYDMYVVRYYGSKDFCIVDKNFEELAFFRGVYKLGFQNIACDDEFIYLLDSGVKAQPGVEIILVYDWDGYFRGVCRLNYASESEAIFGCNGKLYVSFYTGGGRVFEMHFDKDLMR